MSDLARDIASRLLDIQAVKIKMDPPFTWTSGIKSPIYCDNRRMISYPDHRRAVVEGWAQVLRGRVEAGEMKMPDVLGGTATAAIPWAAFLAYELDLPMVYIRKEAKGHGAGKRIEGDLAEGQNVLIVEDLVSTGGSSVSAVEAIREEAKCTVTDIFSIVTYGMQKSIDRFAEAGVTLTALANFEALAQTAVEKGSITAEQEQLVREFVSEPATWAERVGL